MNVVTLCAVLSFSKGRWRICAIDNHARPGTAGPRKVV